MTQKTLAMIEGGKRLGHIKSQTIAVVKAGLTPLEIDHFVDDLIKQGGDKPSFKMVDGYKHATCINVNAGIVHGIPNTKLLKDGDVVKVDMGLFHNGYHLDTSTTIYINGTDPKIKKFLEVSQKALSDAIFMATSGNTVFDISQAMEKEVVSNGFSVIRDLTGHGVGKKLHMTPFIPCFADPKTKRDILSVDQTLAIEVMSAMGGYELVEDSDGWTLSTQDGSITAMYEESVCVTEKGPIILTSQN